MLLWLYLSYDNEGMNGLGIMMNICCESSESYPTTIRVSRSPSIDSSQSWPDCFGRPVTLIDWKDKYQGVMYHYGYAHNYLLEYSEFMSQTGW